jgi:hypothetical protein
MQELFSFIFRLARALISLTIPTGRHNHAVQRMPLLRRGRVRMVQWAASLTFLLTPTLYGTNLTGPAPVLYRFAMALFTSSNARQMADLGRANTKARAEAARTAIATLVADPSIEFESKLLARVRSQLELLNALLLTELSKSRPDAQAIDRLAAAQSRLTEQERIGAGRPMPGSLKPSQAKPARSRVIMPDPAPPPIDNGMPVQSSPDPSTPLPVQSPNQ